MERVVVLLRGVNIGKRRVAMADLRDGLTVAGCGDVRSYVQSGNLVLTPPSGTPAGQDALSSWLSATIGEIAGFDVVVVLRTAEELAEVVASNPYPQAGGSQLHVVFHADLPAADPLATVDLAKYDPEHATWIGREVYLHLPGGMGRSKLASDLAKLPGPEAVTTRNWNTVEQLLAML